MSQDYLSLIRDGLGPHRGPARRVVVVGAGMAGLVAAHELLRAGHEPVLLEGQHRVGGRIYTLREPFAPGLYGEAGAMRIPRAHGLTLAYVEKFGLTLAPFTASSPQAYYHLHGRRWRISEAEADPSQLGFELHAHEQGLTPGQLWDLALKPLAQALEVDGADTWEPIHARFDGYSLREFLEAQQWSEGAIECFGLLSGQEALMNASFLELLREELGGYYTDLLRIEGGMDLLPRAFLPTLGERIRFGTKMIAIDQDPDSVTVHVQSLAGRARVSGDYAILTVPLPVMRHVEVLKPFSRAKQRAIRQLHYDASAKVFLQCRRRFWEQDDGIFGGATLTDLPIRAMYYPDQGRETGRGVLLASYTWSEDAQRWGSLSPTDRIVQALENVALVHPQIIEEFEVGASKMWHDDEFAGGAFALFDPGQQALLHEHIVAPEGRIHFAGEHASLAHAWIQGAIESGLRAAWEVQTSAGG